MITHSLSLLSFCSRLRFLPPLDDDTFFSLRSFAVAILDPFPVGVHIPVLDALVAGIPVVILHWLLLLRLIANFFTDFSSCTTGMYE
jgi:hypothetical protein